MIDDAFSSQDPIRCKTIVVGDSGVGKTTIIGRYINKYNSNEKSTIGASFTNKLEDVNGKQVLFEIWDTAGQERFRSINNIFYQDAYICIMVYDITSRKSFQSLKDYWYTAVKDGGTQGIIFHVAGNKIDLFEEEEVNKNDVKEFCDSINSQYTFISAKENSYIDELFKKLGESFLKSDIYRNLDNKNKSRPERFTLDSEMDDNEENKKAKKKKKKCC